MAFVPSPELGSCLSMYARITILLNVAHFELVHHNNYDCVVSVEDNLISNSFPIRNVECSYVDKIL